MASKEKEVISAVIKQVSPSKEDVTRLAEIEKEILAKIKVPSAKPALGGSGAKGTWLKDTHDIDIYVKFSYAKYAKLSDKISDILEKSLKKSFTKLTRIHGSRDYFQTSQKGYTVEIVPILEIRNAKQAKNITDFSSHHVKYINAKIKKKKSLANEIRITKVFAKANRLYGAESHIKGLSGYAVELLVAHYGSFLNLIKAASKWKSIEIIGNKKTAEKLNWAKKVSPLILIDPVQPDRNAAAALSREQYESIIKSSKSFLAKPSLSFFEKKQINLTELKKKGNLIVIKVKPITAKKDVAGAKALKAFEFIVNSLEKFKVVYSFFEYSDVAATFYIVTKEKSLPKEYRHPGPPIGNIKAFEEFKKANRGYVVKEDTTLKRYYMMKKTRNPEIFDHLKEMLKKEEVTSRVKDITTTTG